MVQTEAHLQALLAEVVKLVGLPYEDYDCWDVVKHAYAMRAVNLDGNYIGNAVGPRRHFDTVMAGDFSHIGVTDGRGYWPQPWDVIVMRNHAFLPTHLGLVLDENLTFIHSMEKTGVSIGKLDRRPWTQPRRILGAVRYRQSFSVGDVVRRYLGGPDMTVSAAADLQYACQWFEGDELRSGNFGSIELKLIAR